MGKSLLPGWVAGGSQFLRLSEVITSYGMICATCDFQAPTVPLPTFPLYSQHILLWSRLACLLLLEPAQCTHIHILSWWSLSFDFFCSNFYYLWCWSNHFFFFKTVSLYCPCWPRTLYIDQSTCFCLQSTGLMLLSARWQSIIFTKQVIRWCSAPTNTFTIQL